MFETQALVNRFPEETRIRTDSSSFGFRLFSILGDITSAFKKDLTRLSFASSVKTSLTDFVVDLYDWDIDSFDFTYEGDMELNPIILPDILGDSIPLEIIEYSETLPYLNPTRVAEIDSLLGSTGTIYESNINEASSIVDIDVPSNLWIEFNGVETFAAIQNPLKERSLLFPSEILLIGEDNYGTEIRESIFPSSNGVYLTKYIYAKLLDFTLTNISGTDATLKIKNFDFNLDNYFSKFHTIIELDSEDTLLLSYDADFVYLKKFIFQVVNNKRISDDKQTFTGHSLSDSDGVVISINDIALIPSTETLIALTDTAIHFYNDWLPPVFDKPTEERTLEITLTAEVPNRYPMINEEIRFYLYQRSINNRVKDYQVKLTDPTGAIFYLQVDDTFATSPWTFGADTDSKWPGSTVNDRWVDFQLDTYGQWELAITSTLSNEEIEVDITCFYVSKLVASKTILLDEVYTAVSYHQDGLIYLKNESGIKVMRPKFDYCFIDSENKRVYTIEKYTNLDVSYE